MLWCKRACDIKNEKKKHITHILLNSIKWAEKLQLLIMFD